ncbi:MAG: hypothetical protein H7A21_15265 [Spirochaetales bacterium]|nr:hypothetical protein [Leptospiraceae bacterium]MCP5482794.1 hypothetical protein [Spirochaetales bacterium]
MSYQTQSQAEAIRRERLASLEAACAAVSDSLSESERAEYKTEINRLQNLLDSDRAGRSGQQTRYGSCWHLKG